MDLADFPVNLQLTDIFRYFKRYACRARVMFFWSYFAKFKIFPLADTMPVSKSVQHVWHAGSTQKLEGLLVLSSSWK